ncbi:hypothetical protein PILCRDRAFT_612869 [Piloderma croceum F 1598]|uniref:Uncharacterized protein n=1 Tax=Piloderma croceum (strain F 1598) TaxID=765440 RepID=A0A0C3FD94_PILCF|nr:hypothetical protein PILCRDRAFT_612869 [Piloderma croceum F 1598]
MQSLEGTDVYLHGGIGGNYQVRGVIGGGQRWWIQHFPHTIQYMICIPRTQTPQWSAVSIGKAQKVGDAPIIRYLDSDAPWGSASQQWRFESSHVN